MLQHAKSSFKMVQTLYTTGSLRKLFSKSLHYSYQRKFHKCLRNNDLLKNIVEFNKPLYLCRCMGHCNIPVINSSNIGKRYDRYITKLHMHIGISMSNLLSIRHTSGKALTGDKYPSMRNPKVLRYLKKIYQKLNHEFDELEGHEKSQALQLQPLIEKAQEYWSKEEEVQELQKMIADSTTEKDLLEMAAGDLQKLEQELITVEEEIIEMLVPQEEADDTDVILQFTAGVGGLEAMLFTSEILDMYEGYAAYCGWNFDIIQVDYEQGGVRHASAAISGDNVYQWLKYEGGVHRVQRVPKTERTGRIHTSTMTVAVMPQPTEVELYIDLKRDLKITTMKASGAGGQHVNTTDSAVRIVHIPTGLAVACQTTRSQMRNKDLALLILRSKLYQQETAERRQRDFTQRKLQVGSAGRSEKIRTYNYQQDRVTDHRIGKSTGQLRSFLTGGERLDSFIKDILEVARMESLLEMLEQSEYSDRLKSIKR